MPMCPGVCWAIEGEPTMSTRLNGTVFESEAAVGFAPNAKSNADQLDKAGETILQLLHRAAGAAEDNSRQALQTAQKLSHQLRAAESRISEVEAEIEGYRDRTERAEQWL